MTAPVVPGRRRKAPPGRLTARGRAVVTVLGLVAWFAAYGFCGWVEGLQP